VHELIRFDVPTTTRDETLDVALDKFSRSDAQSIAVLDDRRRVEGVLTRARLMEKYQRALEEVH
jgi:CBS-domain-containing membrane protein